MYSKPTRLNMPYTTLSTAPDVDRSAVTHYAVRVGVHGQVGRLSGAGTSYRRGAQVICRTARGLEVGCVLSPLNWSTAEADSTEFDGRIVRAMAAEDQLLWNHLKQLAEEAHANCQTWLTEAGLSDRLLEVEPLLDGRTLYFHFLDEVSSQAEQHIEQLVQIFQRTVAESSFAKLLETGCGPGCGTDKAKGCGGACTTCAFKNRCGAR